MAERPLLSGETLAAIANELVSIKAQFYGKGPTQAKAYINDEVVVCVMREGLTTVEQTLLAGGDEGLVRQVRIRFQEQLNETFSAAVERLSGRRVLAFTSQVTFSPDYAFELCVLGEPLADGEPARPETVG